MRPESFILALRTVTEPGSYTGRDASPSDASVPAQSPPRTRDAAATVYRSPAIRAPEAGPSVACISSMLERCIP
ncbi:hypothetical protein GY45DRAFT_47486 [Cubamyces sp. BRFM 1775]|nr:hypothetical protein GY45DRAFT_47486 [Cubamyces sp. BRFM 1775]